MAAKRLQRLFRAGHRSLLITIPLDWAHGMGLGVGSVVEVEYGDEVMVVRPTKKNDKEMK